MSLEEEEGVAMGAGGEGGEGGGAVGRRIARER